MPFTLPSDTVARCESKTQHSVVVDDLDAFEMLAPTAREGRVFMCKLIQSLSSFLRNKSSGIHSNILSVVAYGRQMCMESPEKYPLFPGSVRVSCASSTRNDFEPSLTEYCRYR